MGGREVRKEGGREGGREEDGWREGVRVIIMVHYFLSLQVWCILF